MMAHFSCHLDTPIKREPEELPPPDWPAVPVCEIFYWLLIDMEGSCSLWTVKFWGL